MQIRPVAWVHTRLAVSDPHVGANGEGLLLPSNLSIAVEQNGPAALVLMQQAAVLEVSHQREFTLHSERHSNKVSVAATRSLIVDTAPSVNT